MISVNELRTKLPSDFIEEMNSTFTSNYVDKILLGMTDKRNTTIRVNSLKTNIQDLMNYLKENNIKFDRVLWYENALIIKNATEKDLQNLSWFNEGKFYMQSLSSMIPPIVLKPEPKEIVLDLTAAPGSKTTQIAMMMKNEGKIVANELDQIRCERLKYNLSGQGVTIAETINGRGEVIGKKYPEYFDKVLLDAPCSGEGRFLGNSPATSRNWSLKLVKELSRLQKKLFRSAYESLKHGGIMVYSTCTLNFEENEEILKWAKENFDIKIEKIDLAITNGIKAKSNLPEDRMIYLDDSRIYPADFSNAIRVYPSQVMEGFFIAKIVKN
jgi:16S rRNA (cytosine1407-C5)-methyltransferase